MTVSLVVSGPVDVETTSGEVWRKLCLHLYTYGIFVSPVSISGSLCFCLIMWPILSFPGLLHSLLSSRFHRLNPIGHCSCGFCTGIRCKSALLWEVELVLISFFPKQRLDVIASG